jgi:hypothetical protein
MKLSLLSEVHQYGEYQGEQAWQASRSAKTANDHFRAAKLHQVAATRAPGEEFAEQHLAKATQHQTMGAELKKSNESKIGSSGKWPSLSKFAGIRPIRNRNQGSGPEIGMNDY